MKSYILHGDNQTQIRNKLLQLTDQAKAEGLGVFNIDWKKSNENELKLTSRTQGLISFGQLLIIDNFFINNKKVIDIIENLPKENAYYIFTSDKSLTPAQIRALQKSFDIQEFTVPKSIFRLLDIITPGNAKQALILLKQPENQKENEFILIMFLRQIRLLIWTKEDPESLNLASWQKNKLISQASKFTSPQLRVLHTKLLDLDRMNKKSQLPEGLGESLELLVASI